VLCRLWWSFPAITPLVGSPGQTTFGRGFPKSGAPRLRPAPFLSYDRPMSNHSRNRGNVVTRVATHDLDTDEGRGKAFRQLAGECLGGAQALSAHYPHSIGQYILTAHALELALKAFLAKTGFSDKQLRKKPLGHNLAKLYEAASKQGLSLSVYGASTNIQWMGEYHSAPLRYEYRTRELPSCNVFFPIVEVILEAVK
jgi:hypothetical protein